MKTVCPYICSYSGLGICNHSWGRGIIAGEVSGRVATEQLTACPQLVGAASGNAPHAFQEVILRCYWLKTQFCMAEESLGSYRYGGVTSLYPHVKSTGYIGQEQAQLSPLAMHHGLLNEPPVCDPSLALQNRRVVKYHTSATTPQNTVIGLAGGPGVGSCDSLPLSWIPSDRYFSSKEVFLSLRKT